MKHKLSMAVSAALFSMSANAASDLSEGLDARQFSPESLQPARLISVNKGGQVTPRKVPVKFIVEKGLEDKPYVYIVRLQDQAVANYDGGIQGYPATNPQKKFKAKGTSLQKAPKLDKNAPEVKSYAKYLDARQQSFLNSAENIVSGLETVATYKFAFNGVAVKATPSQAEALSKLPSVKTVERSLMYKLDTDVGPGLIGANGIWDGTETDDGVGTLGEGVIVGIIDSGINTDHDSFADIGGDGYDHTNPFGEGVYVGDCAGDFPEMCNDKLIGVRSYPSVTDVYADTTIFPADLPANGEDYDGHGSHVASTAAGNVINNVDVLTPDVGVENSDGVDTGFDFERISGVAPHANIIAYQVCLPGNQGDTYSGCTGAAILSSQEDAILDGIDVVNYSIGIAGPAPNLAWTNSSELGFLAMRNAGIFVATSAGNSGPDAGTTTKQAPWYTAVAASTHGRAIEYPKEIGEFTGGDSELGTLTGNNASGGISASIVYAGDFENANDPDNDPAQCLQPFPEGTFSGEIVVCDRGAIARVQKAINARDSGAGGVVLANVQGAATSVNNDVFVIPGIHIDADQADMLRAWLASGEGHTATITASEGNLIFGQGDDLAGFSSRGPNITASTLSPFVAAPGVDVYAAYADEDYGNDQTGPGPTDYNFLGGTSMASPHVAGAGALLTALHPTWTPDNIRSALMMTATTAVRKEDGVTQADWFDMGSGRIQVNMAAQAGLVMDETAANYEAANPEAGGDPSTLNLPSLTQNNCVGVCSWTRTVTATKDGEWSLSTTAISAGVELTVSPETFTLAAGESQEITVSADVLSAERDAWSFAQLNLTSSVSPDLHMPISIVASTGNLPSNLDLSASRNSDSYLLRDVLAVEITDFTARSFGLVKADLTEESLPVDSANGSIYDDLEDGLYITTMSVPEGAKRMVAEILESASPDLDLFVGLDANADGLPQEDELVALSATGTALEKIDLLEPTAGDYWVVVQNWAASSEGASDAFTLATAVVDGEAGDNLTISTDSNTIAQLTPFDVRVGWSVDAVEGDKFYGAMDVGTDAENAGNLGLIAVELDRVTDDVRIVGGSEERVNPGDTLEYAVEIASNFTPEDRYYEVSVSIPENMNVVEGSITDDGVYADGVITWNYNQPTLFGATPSYTATTNLADASCVNPNFGQGSGYLDLAGFGIGFSGVDGDTTSGTFNVAASFLGTLYNSITLTDDGFATVFGETGSTPWVNQLMPDDTAPNGVIAPFWRDMIINNAGGSGISVATAGSAVTILEWDDMQPWTPDGSSTGDILDFQIVFMNEAGPGTPNIIFSYDNVTHANQIATSVGYEDATGTTGLTTHYLGSASDPIGDVNADVVDGAQVCLWLSIPDNTKQLGFSLEVPEDNIGGTVELLAMSSLPNNVGTAAEVSATNANFEIEGAPVVTINGVSEAEMEVLEFMELPLPGAVFEPNGDAFEILWRQIDGPAAVIAGNGIAEAVLIAPEVTEDSTITLEMKVTEDNGTVVTATASVLVKNNLAPEISVSAPASVEEGNSFTVSVFATDNEGDALTYYIDGEMTQSVTVTAPFTESDTSMSFEVIVSDGINQVTETVTVTVTDSSGGGSAGWLTLLLLPLVYMRRRKH